MTQSTQKDHLCYKKAHILKDFKENNEYENSVVKTDGIA